MSLWALALTCVALLCTASGATGKKPAKVHCRRGTVPVKILGTTRCHALPRPAQGDPRHYIHSGSTGITKSSPDGFTYDGSATAKGADNDPENWTWSLMGSP